MMRPIHKLLAVVFISSAKAQKIAENCIEQQSVVGQESNEKYSDLTQIHTQVDREMHLYAYQECTENTQGDGDGALVSFITYLSDYDEDNETRVQLSRIGPDVEDSVCSGHTFPSRYINQAAIYEENGRIYGIRFKSGELDKTRVTDIGRLQGTGKLSDFNENAQLVGFHGSSDGNIITSLGFITYDRSCQEKENDAIDALEAVPVPPRKEDAEDEDVDEDNSGFGALIAICASSLFLLGLLGVLVYCFCIRKSKNKPAVLILGTVGVGKSNFLNMLAGKNVFESK